MIIVILTIVLTMSLLVGTHKWRAALAAPYQPTWKDELCRIQNCWIAADIGENSELDDDALCWVTECMEEIADPSDQSVAVGPGNKNELIIDLSSIAPDWNIEVCFNVLKRQINIDAQHNIITSYKIFTVIPGIKDQKESFGIAIYNIAQLTLLRE